jgi:DNA-binding transcriptional LysR family regulator
MSLRLDYVAGVSPAKWLRAWADRRPDLPLEAERVDEAVQLDRLRREQADVAFVRLPIDETGLHRIPLWEEVAVAALPKDHPLAEADALELADLEGEPRAPEQDDPAMTLELVAAGTGWAILPHSLARLHARRDVVAIPVTDAAPTRIALVWRVERDDDDVQEFVGVVRGRTARSSRGADDPGDADAAPAKAAPAPRGDRRKGGGRAGGRTGGTHRGGRQNRRGGRRR